MVGTVPPVITVPFPRRPLESSDQVRRWYENELGWPTVPETPGSPLRLAVGPRFDVLDVPLEAGRAGLRHLAPGSPVAVQGDRMRLLLAAGSADEVPGVLDWLEWGALPLDLVAIGEGGTIDAPLLPEPGASADAVGLLPEQGSCAEVVQLLPEQESCAQVVRLLPAQGSAAVVRRPLAPGSGAARCLPEPGPTGPRPLPAGRSGALQGAAVWLRPPVPGYEAEASLPTLSALGGGGGAPDLVRLLATVATWCHRLRLRACAQPPASS
ncbi:SCO3374 family protein [Streptomyces sp. NPDC001536]|uniref:SCO3374 family protein n=1 Tax=Streptomyces sp. NPDC001536 TaxID=3364583 RepID=UPI003678B4C0